MRLFNRPDRTALAEGFSHQFSVPDLRRRVSAASTAAAVPVVSESPTGLGASPSIRRARGDGIPPERYPAQREQRRYCAGRSAEPAPSMAVSGITRGCRTDGAPV